MEEITLKQVNENILTLRRQLDMIREMIEESSLELSEESKDKIIESRNRPISQFKTQEEIEKRFYEV